MGVGVNQGVCVVVGVSQVFCEGVGEVVCVCVRGEDV